MKGKSLSKSAKRKFRRRGLNSEWVTYPRCFLLTLGLLFTALGGAGLVSLGRATEPVAPWIPWLLAGCLLTGLWAIFTGFFGSRKDAASLAEKASSGHEATILIMIVAAPLYWLLRLFSDRRD